MIDKPVTLHVGFSKTATTSLQDSVFARLPGLANLGKPFLEGGARKPLYEAIVHLTFAEELAYDAQGSFERFSDVVKRSAGSILISSEGLSYARHNDQALVARRLRAIFANASIVFTIREQTAWIRSLYLDDCGRFVFTQPMPRLETWFALERGKRNRSALQMANFEPTIRLYEELFGRERVHVFAYEQMLADSRGFSEALGRVLRVDASQLYKLVASLPRSNAALSRAAYRFGLFNYYFVPPLFRRYVARLPESIRKRMLAGQAPRVVLPQHCVELIREHVRAGNRALMARHALDLDAYGYAV
jgi:hypothetical protein